MQKSRRCVYLRLLEPNIKLNEHYKYTYYVDISNVYVIYFNFFQVLNYVLWCIYYIPHVLL